MSTKDSDKQEGEATLNYLRRTRRFGDYMLCAWAEVEANIDSMILSLFLPSVGDSESDDIRETKGEYLLRPSFKDKLDMLKKLGRAKSKEYAILDKFRRARNELFHGVPFKEWITDLSDSKKDEYMELAMKAVWASTEVLVPDFENRLKELNKQSNPKDSGDKRLGQ